MEFHCPHCQIKLEMEDGASGHEVTCPACQGVIVVPAAKIPPTPFSPPAAPQKMGVSPADYKVRSGGGGFFKFVLLLILLALLAFGIACYQSNQPPQVVYQRLVDAVIQLVSPPAPTPAPPQKPAAQKPAAPPPVVVAAQPKPPAPPPPTNVVVAPLPPAPPEPDPITWIQGQAQKSTVEITLLADTTFPILYNGKAAGSGNLPAPSTVKLVNVDPEGGKVTVSYPGYGNGTATVPIASTDLLERARADLKKAEADAQAEEVRKLDAAASEAPTNAAATAAPAPSASPEANPGEADLAVGESSVKAGAFVHPGLLHNEEDFERMRTHIGREPWKSGWERLIANGHAQLDYKPRPVENVVRGADRLHTEPQNYVTCYNDAAAAYACALRWRISGDSQYADKSIEILNAWSPVLKTVTGSSDKSLASGIYGYEFANAGEIMRTYKGWRPEDFARFQAMMLNIFYPMNHEFLAHRNGQIDHYWANWDLCNMASMIAIGVLCDRRDIYNEAVDYFKHGGGNGAVEHAVYFIHPGGLGQWNESGRDQAHTTMGVGLMGAVCEMAWKQGDDLYGYDNNRFLAGCEYVAKYNLGEDVPFKPFQDSLATQDVISSAGRGNVRPVWELIYNHYVKLKGLPAPYTTKAAEGVRPEGGGGDYGPNSGGYDQLGYGTLTATLDPQQTEPSASTHTAPAESATLNPPPIGSTDGGPTIPDLPAKVLPPGEKSPLITSFTPTVHEIRSATSGLLHPGIIQTKEQLDTMQCHVRNGDQPWASAFAAFSQVRNCSTDPPILYAGWTDIPRGGGLGKGGNFVTFRMAKDANTAFKQVVMWYITGDETYRLNALKIIRDYCAIKTIAVHWDAQIRWGIASYQMCCAAEVLRYSDGNTDASRWTDDDTAQFSALVKTGEFLVAPPDYWMNQHGFSTMGVMGTAIFLDDKALYEEAVERTTVNYRGQQGGRNGSIEWQMRLVTENFQTHEKVTPQVQLVEMIRDQHHAWDDVAALSTLCQTIYNQGMKVDPVTGTVSTAANAVDVFEFLDNRFLAGVDYITRYTLGEPVTWIPIDMGDQIKGDPAGFYDLGILYNHYKYIEKWSTKDPRFHAVAEAYESLIPEPDAVDVPCESTLLLTPDNAAAPQQTEPGASTHTAPAETAALNPSPDGSAGGGPTSLGPRTFIHPGIPLTKEDLDEVKRDIDHEPWRSAFEALKNDPEAQLDRKMYGPFDKVCRTPDINLTPWKRDMNAFYKLSLLWYLTGDEAYAQKAHDVLMAYVKGQKSFGGVEMYLSLGDYADTVLGGADILRGTWPGWTAEDTDLSKAYFRNLYAGTINDGAWSIGPLRSANQGALQLINYVCVSVFLDDSDMFNNCVRMFLADPETGLTDTLPNGELGDTGRDQGHAAGELIRTLLAAEVFWKQGVDVYSARDNRLLAMGEFYARYNLNYPTPFMPFGTKYTLFPILPPLPGPGKPSTKIAAMIYKAYTLRMGLSAPYSAKALDANPFDADTFLYYKIADHSTALPPPPMPAPAPTEPLTDGLDNVEIGDASPGGSGDFAGGTWTVRGSGTAGMLNPPWGKWAWRGDDSCHFAYRKVTGDATLIARVTSVEEVQNFTMAGLMIRDSLEPRAARMAVWSTPNGREKGPSVETDLRGFTHSSHDSSFQIHENAAIPYWLKLERVGDRITCWHSPDGASWTPIEDGLFPAMDKTAYLGLFVCSTLNGKTATATFDTVRMTGGGGVEQVKTPAAPFAIYGGPGDGQVPLRWLESFGATSYNVKRSETKGGPYQTIAAVKGTSLVDKAVTNGETYYYVVSAMNSAGESPDSLEDSVTPRSP